MHRSHHPIPLLMAGPWLPLQAPLGASISDQLARPRARGSSVITPGSPSPPSLTSPQVWPSLGCWVMRGTQNRLLKICHPFSAIGTWPFPSSPQNSLPIPSSLQLAPPYISINVSILKCKIAQRWPLPSPGKGIQNSEHKGLFVFPVWRQVSGKG